MSIHLQQGTNFTEPMVYQIRIRGQLDVQWTDWFEGLTITQKKNGDTLLTGPMVDQAALYGLLKKVRDLGMPLLSLKSVKPHRTSSKIVYSQSAQQGKNDEC